MILRMARPWKHPDSGYYYLRERLPRDLPLEARGLRVAFPAAAGGSSFKISPKAQHVKASLRTRDPREAKERHAAASAHLNAVWAAVRRGPKRLSKMQLVALSGEIYRAFGSAEADPGPASQWRNVQEMDAHATQGSALYIGTPAERRRMSMDARFGRFADGLLVSKGIITDAASRTALIEEIAKATTQVAKKLERNANSDFRPDLEASRFPAWRQEDIQLPQGAVTVTGLLAGWERESRATEAVALWDR